MQQVTSGIQTTSLKKGSGFPREKMMSSDCVFVSEFNLLNWLILYKYYVLDIRNLLVSVLTAFMLGFLLALL